MNKNLLLLKKLIHSNRQKLSMLSLVLVGLFASYNIDAQTFPCGYQDLQACACDGTGDLIADSEPCTFSSAQLQQFVLVDVPNALVPTDNDDNSIVAVSTSGVFNSVPTGDYIVYVVYYEPVDAPFFNGQLQVGNNLALLTQLGDEISAGFWTSDVPNFTMVASDLASVNGPQCSCSSIDIVQGCSCDDVNNYVEAGVTYVRDVIQITSGAGETWNYDLSQSGGAYDASANQLSGSLTATEVSSGVYEFIVFYVPGVGHTSSFNNGNGQEHSVSNLGQDCICDFK